MARALTLVALVVGLWGSDIAHSSAQVAVTTIRGARANQLRRLLADRLRDRGHMVVDLRSSSGRDLEAIAERTGARSLIRGRLRRRGGRWHAVLNVYDSRGEHASRAVGRHRRIGGLAAQLSRRLDLGTDPEATEEPTETPPEAPSEETSETPETPPGAPSETPSETPSDPPDGTETTWPALELGAGVQLFQRSLGYTDDIYGFMREYQLELGPQLEMDLGWYPGAHFTRSAVAHVGVGFHYERSIGLHSTDEAGTRFPTRAREWMLSLVGRIPLGDHLIRAALGVGQHAFQIDNAARAENRLNIPVLPGTRYRFIDVRVGANLAIYDRLSGEIALAYRAVRDAGGIQEDVWFPLATVRGYVAQVQLRYAITHGLGVYAGFGLRRYILDSNIRADDDNGRRDPNVVGGATDQYLSYTLGVRY